MLCTAALGCLGVNKCLRPRHGAVRKQYLACGPVVSLVLSPPEGIASGSGRSLGGTAEADADASQLAGLAAGAVEVFGLQKVFGPSWTRCGFSTPRPNTCKSDGFYANDAVCSRCLQSRMQSMKSRPSLHHTSTLQACSSCLCWLLCRICCEEGETGGAHLWRGCCKAPGCLRAPTSCRAALNY